MRYKTLISLHLERTQTGSAWDSGVGQIFSERGWILAEFWERSVRKSFTCKWLARYAKSSSPKVPLVNSRAAPDVYSVAGKDLHAGPAQWTCPHML